MLPMKTFFLTLLTLFLLATPFTFAGADGPANAPQSPLFFEPNAGQTSAAVRYVARSREGSIFFTSEGVTVAVPKAGSLRLTFAGSLPQPKIAAEDLLPS